MTNRSSVTTSTKDDVLRVMASANIRGSVLLFDPSGTVATPPGVTRIGYSPMHQSRRWDGAVLATRSLLSVQSHTRGGASEDHWVERAGALIAPLLHAAALRHESLDKFLMRVDRRDASELEAELRRTYGESHPSVNVLRGVLATEERERSGIWSSASGLFSGMRTESARRAAHEPNIEIDEFLASPHQLHIVSPSRHQNVTTPLIVGLIDYLVHATYDAHHRGARLLLALDEVANVAPLPGLAAIVSEGGGQGVVTLACLQDLSQARTRWGRTADGFLSLFPATVVLPGIADRTTLEMLSSLSGVARRSTESITTNRWRRRTSVATRWVTESVLRPADIAHGRAGYALALTTRKEIRWLRLTPAHEDDRFYARRGDVDPLATRPGR